MAYCEEASAALFAATETDCCVVESVVDKSLCALLVSTAAAMSDHSCLVAVALLRVCCKCVQLLPAQTAQQLQDSKTVQRLTTVLKSSTVQHGPQHANTAAVESLRMYSSMLLVSLASELGDSVLQVTHSVFNYLFQLIDTNFAAAADARQHAPHMRHNERQFFPPLGFIGPNRFLICTASPVSRSSYMAAVAGRSC